MVIDIDSFLESYEKDKSKTSASSKNKETGLDFQKDIEDKISNVLKGANKEDFKALLHIYSELKKFDEDLPRKLIGIKKTSGTALKSIGSKYSEEFLKNITSNMQNLTKTIRNKILEIDNNISSGNFTQAISSYSEILKLFKTFPKEFTKEKIELSSEIRKREIMLNEKLRSIKEVEIKRIKETINKEISELKVEIKKDNIDSIENKLERINYIMDKIPKIFFVELIEERISVAKTLMKVEKYLENEYIEKFQEKKEIIYKLFDNFHKYFLNKDSNNALATYDEILLEFEKVPEVFINEKMEIYKQIGDIFDSLNNLLLTSNVNLFLESYNSSKILLEAKDYVTHIKKTNRYDVETLKDLAHKLNSVPNTFKSQKDEILMEMKKLTNIQNDNFKENKTLEKVSPRENNNNSNNDDANLELVSSKSTNHVNKGIADEINSYFEKIKKSSDKKEISILYKKITFYLSMLHIDESKKKEIIEKVNNVLKNKK
jgi:hypothetical protein